MTAFLLKHAETLKRLVLCRALKDDRDNRQQSVTALRHALVDLREGLPNLQEARVVEELSCTFRGERDLPPATDEDLLEDFAVLVEHEREPVEEVLNERRPLAAASDLGVLAVELGAVYEEKLRVLGKEFVEEFFNDMGLELSLEPEVTFAYDFGPNVLGERHGSEGVDGRG